jgi:hypothetical protein
MRRAFQRKSLSALLSLLLILALFAGFPASASAASTWDGTYPAVDLNSTYGGAIYLGSGSLTITGGTISGNTVGPNNQPLVEALGSGVYVGGGTFTVTPASGVAFSLADTIYLTDGEYINVGANLPASIGKLTVQVASPASGVLIAERTDGSGFTNANANRFAYAGGGFTFFVNSADSTQIIIQ